MKQFSSIVIFGLLTAVALLFAPSAVEAAYPKVPKEVQEDANAKLIALRKRSDEIWKQARTPRAPRECGEELNHDGTTGTTEKTTNKMEPPINADERR
jgi:hypothetical protein